jgi:hypothetical protein
MRCSGTVIVITSFAQARTGTWTSPARGWKKRGHQRSKESSVSHQAQGCLHLLYHIATHHIITLLMPLTPRNTHKPPRSMVASAPAARRVPQLRMSASTPAFGTAQSSPREGVGNTNALPARHLLAARGGLQFERIRARGQLLNQSQSRSARFRLNLTRINNISNNLVPDTLG